MAINATIIRAALALNSGVVGLGDVDVGGAAVVAEDFGVGVGVDVVGGGVGELLLFVWADWLTVTMVAVELTAAPALSVT